MQFNTGEWVVSTTLEIKAFLVENLLSEKKNEHNCKTTGSLPAQNLK